MRRRALLGAALATPAFAAGWPERPLRIVVPFAAGSFTDTAARLLAQELAGPLGQAVVVENKGGAGGTLGAAQVVRSPADGYMLLLTDNSLGVAPGLYPDLPFDPARDLVQVSRIADTPSLLQARPGLGVRTLAELVAKAKAAPGSITFGSGGQGSSAHLAMELLMGQTGMRLTHVPFRGIAAAITEVLAGNVDLAISSIASGITHIRAGTLLGLAVSGERRATALPQVPTFAEAGAPGGEMQYWFGLAAPRGIPPAVLARLNAETVRALAQPRLVQAFAAQGALPAPCSPEAAQAHLEREISLWRGVIARAGVKAE